MGPLCSNYEFALSYSVQQEVCVIHVLCVGVPTAVVGFQPRCVIIFCVFKVCAKLQFTARILCDTSEMRWGANRSGWVSTAVLGFQPLRVIFFLFLKFVLSYSVQQELCMIQVKCGGVPTAAVECQPQ